jgi:hypothetical protein
MVVDRPIGIRNQADDFGEQPLRHVFIALSVSSRDDFDVHQNHSYIYPSSPKDSSPSATSLYFYNVLPLIVVYKHLCVRLSE